VPYNRSWPSYIPLDHYGQANYPDGMLRTPPVELAHFLIAFMQGGSYEGKRILQRATVDEMLSSQTELNQSQGLVWFRASVDGQAVWGHDGSDDGASAGMWFDPEDDVGVILVANGNWKDESGIFEALFDEADEYD
jgi:CubicO group peptidase (beta-lactamase class C family)